MANLILPKRYGQTFRTPGQPVDAGAVEVDRENHFGRHLYDALIPAFMSPRVVIDRQDRSSPIGMRSLLGTAPLFEFDNYGASARTVEYDLGRPYSDAPGGPARGFFGLPDNEANGMRYETPSGVSGLWPYFPHLNFSVVSIFRHLPRGDISSEGDSRIFARDQGSSSVDHDLMIGLVRSGSSYQYRTRVRDQNVVRTEITDMEIEEGAWNLIAGGVRDIGVDDRTTVAGLRADGQFDTSTSSGSTNSLAFRDGYPLAIGAVAGANSGGFYGDILGVWFFDKWMDEAELREFYRNPWQLFKPKVAPILFTTGAPGPTPIPAEPQDLAHAHTLTTPDTDRNTSRTPAPVAHAHTLTTPSASSGKLADAADLTHAHELETPDPDRNTARGAADVAHAHALTTPSATSGKLADAADLLHPHALATPDRQVGRQRTPAPLSHAHELSQPSGSTGTLTDPQDVIHAHTVGTPSRQVTTPAAPDELTHAHTLTTPSASSNVLVDPADVAHVHTLGTPTATAATTATPDNVVHLHALATPDATKRTSRTPAPLIHSHSLSVAVAFIPFEGKRFPDLADQMQRQVVKTLGEPMSTPFGDFDGIFEAEWFDPNLGPLGFEAAQTYVEFLGEQVRLQRDDTVFRQRDGRTYRVKEIREGEFDFIRYMLELVA